MTTSTDTRDVAVNANQEPGALTGFRVEMGSDDPVYAFWFGSGVKNDANAISFVKRNGDGYFDLMPRATPAAAEQRRAQAIGFDAWMRERTEAAHQAMMRRARLTGLHGAGAQPV